MELDDGGSGEASDESTGEVGDRLGEGDREGPERRRGRGHCKI